VSTPLTRSLARPVPIRLATAPATWLANGEVRGASLRRLSIEPRQGSANQSAMDRSIVNIGLFGGHRRRVCDGFIGR
jgi:hypothetical protein